MKKTLSLTSLALLGVLALTGCSCGSKGTYAFSHIEYEKDGEKKETTCEDPTASEMGMCAVYTVSYKNLTITLDGNKMISKRGNLSSELFYKIEDGVLKNHSKEDAEEYNETEFKYEFMGKLVSEYDTDGDDKPDFKIVFKKQ